MSKNLPNWLLPLWQRTERRSQLPHALLLVGPPGSGKRQFAEALAQAVLCQRPVGPQQFACQDCLACSWFKADNHPDMYRIVPAAEETVEEGEGEGERKEKKKSTQIVIDQIRDLQGVLEVSGHQGGRRMVLLEPAESMNAAAANALLKSLEEPPSDTLFLLISHSPKRLLPTIRSRCQVWQLPRPNDAEANAWLSQQGLAHNAALLGFYGGLPLALEAASQGGLVEARTRFIKDLLSLPKTDPLKLAAQWETWLKSKDAERDGLNTARLMDWLQRWLIDASLLAKGLEARFFADFAPQIRTQTQSCGAQWPHCYQEMLAYRRVAQHPLNTRLFWEDVLLRLTRHLQIQR